MEDSPNKKPREESMAPPEQPPIQEEHIVPTRDNMLDRGEKIAADMKAENDRAEQIVARRERLAAREMLGGVGDAGREPEKKKTLTPEEYKDAIMRGEVPNEKE